MKSKKKYIPLLLMTLILSMGFCSCSKEEENYKGESTPLNWEINNESPSDIAVKVLDNGRYEIITNEVGGKLIFSCLDNISYFPYLSIYKKYDDTHKYEGAMEMKIYSDNKGNLIQELVEINGSGNNKITTGEIRPLNYEGDICKINIDFPLVTIDFPPFNQKEEDYQLDVTIKGGLGDNLRSQFTLKRK